MATSYTVLSRKRRLVLLPETINAVGIPFESLILLATVVAVLMAVSAQVVIRLTMRQTQRLPARMSGFAAARKVLDDAGLDDVRMLLQVHDELVFEAPATSVEAAMPVIRRVMEEAAMPAIALSVPLQVEARAADNWDEAH